MTIALLFLEAGSIKPIVRNRAIWNPQLDKAKKLARKLGLSVAEAQSILNRTRIMEGK